MPGRLTPLVNDQIYHVFNLGIDHRPTFTDKQEFKRAMTVLSYYRFNNLPLRLSYFLKLSADEQTKRLEELNKDNNLLVEIICFCFMPNHFHFLLKQKIGGGISKFLSNLQNSYTRYFNTKNKRIGPLFLDQFKAVIIRTDEQFVHVSRYIHLNPLTSYVVKEFEDLNRYPWSSFSEYMNNETGICHKEGILNFFKDSKSYKKFIEDQVDYQRELDRIKHLILE